MRSLGRTRRGPRSAGPVRPVRSLAFGLVAAILATAVPAAGQAIEGRMVEAGSNEAIAGASVILLDATGARVDFALTGADGAYRLEAPGPGAYRIAWERIGYRGGASDAFELAAGAVATRRLEAPAVPVALPTIEAVTERRCDVRPAEGEAASRIWEEVRKALEAAAWTERRRALRYTLRTWERRLDPRTLEVVEESTRIRENATRSSPWVADDPERLVREGFVRKEGHAFVYSAPDASTLLSDAFLDTHCFRPVSPPPEAAGWVGLAFEPDGGSDVADVRGVLWVDRESAELELLDFDYVGLPRELRYDVAGGRVEFERLPSGEWIVERWRIRMPIVGIPGERATLFGIPMDASRSRPQLIAVEEDGGRVESTRH